MRPIKFHLEADDYIDLMVKSYNMSKTGKRLRLLNIVLPGAGLLSVSGICFVILEVSAAVVVTISCLGSWIFLFFTRKEHWNASIRRRMTRIVNAKDTKKDLLSERTVVFGETSLREERQGITTEVPYERISHVSETDKCYAIYLSSIDVLLVPKHALSADEDTKLRELLLANKIDKA